jgi:hypothetical protein
MSREKMLSARECLVARDDMPPVAAHIVTSRTGYTHHGIYMGDGKVVHYSGLSRGWKFGPVEEISLREFSRGRPVRVRSPADSRFDPTDVVARARSRIGEGCYSILSNNCEHFCEWCVCGESRSPQVESLRRQVQYFLATITQALNPARAGAMRPRECAPARRGPAAC